MGGGGRRAQGALGKVRAEAWDRWEVPEGWGAFRPWSVGDVAARKGHASLEHGRVLQVDGDGKAAGPPVEERLTHACGVGLRPSGFDDPAGAFLEEAPSAGVPRTVRREERREQAEVGSLRQGRVVLS